MNVKRMTAERSVIWACCLGVRRTRQPRNAWGSLRARRWRRFWPYRSRGTGVGSGPAAAASNSSRRLRRRKPGLPTPPQDAYTPAPTNPPIPVSLGRLKISLHARAEGLPYLIAPYSRSDIPEPVLTNSPRGRALIHDGKLEIHGCKTRSSWPSRTAWTSPSSATSLVCRH